MEVCPKCHWINKKKCFLCGKTYKHWIKVNREIVVKNAHLHDVWLRLKMYKQLSSGDPQTDVRLVWMFGHWLGKTYRSPNFVFLQSKEIKDV